MVRFRRRQLGHNAERQARTFLKRRGLTTVASNFHTRRGELDLVMRDGDCLVFVEVRFRRASSPVDAAFTVDARKQRKLAQAATVFLARHGEFRHSPCRFDVVGIDRDACGRERIHWVCDAFRPDA